MARRWRTKPNLDPNRFTLTQKDGWWTATAKPKPARAPGTGPKLPPREYIGDPTLASYRKEPRLNPNDYEWSQGEDGRFYAVRRTELSGLGPEARASIRDFDAQGQAQEQRIQGSWADLATQQQAAAQQNAQALRDFQSLSGAGAGSADPTAARLASLNQQGSTAAQTPVMASVLRMPALLQAQGASALQAYQAARQQNRAGLISGYRQQAAEAQAAAQEAAARMRGDNLSLLGRLAGYDAAGARAVLSSQTSLAGQQAATDRSAAAQAGADRRTAATQAGQDRRTAAQISAQDARAAADRASRQLIAQLRVGQAGGARPADFARWAKRASDLAAGVPTTTTEQIEDPNNPGKFIIRNVTKRDPATAPRIYRELLNMGASPQQARAIVSRLGALDPSSIRRALRF